MLTSTSIPARIDTAAMSAGRSLSSNELFDMDNVDAQPCTNAQQMPSKYPRFELSVFEMILSSAQGVQAPQDSPVIVILGPEDTFHSCLACFASMSKPKIGEQLSGKQCIDRKISCASRGELTTPSAARLQPRICHNLSPRLV